MWWVRSQIPGGNVLSHRKSGRSSQNPREAVGRFSQEPEDRTSAEIQYHHGPAIPRLRPKMPRARSRSSPMLIWPSAGCSRAPADIDLLRRRGRPVSVRLAEGKQRNGRLPKAASARFGSRQGADADQNIASDEEDLRGNQAELSEMEGRMRASSVAAKEVPQRHQTQTRVISGQTSTEQLRALLVQAPKQARRAT